MKLPLKYLFVCLGVLALPAWAQDGNGCPEGSYAMVVSPDGTTLSVLFDRFSVEGAPRQRKICRISAPLNLPAGRSLGVYKVDYRGFAKLAAKQASTLDVQYFLGPHDNAHGRVFKRKVKGPHEDDYAFTEVIGAGQMKRVGCGTAALLNVDIALGLEGDAAAGAAMASLDSADAAPGGALVFHLDLKPCP